MDQKHFELLLAMMRLLKREDQLGSSLEAAIVNILDSFETYFDALQKQSVSKEFIRYQSQVQKRKTEDETVRRIEVEEYKAIVSSFFKQEIGW